MNSVSFAYWLQGFFELTDSNTLTEEQVKVIREHLNLVFKKVTALQVSDKKEEESDPIEFGPIYSPDTYCGEPRTEIDCNDWQIHNWHPICSHGKIC